MFRRCSIRHHRRDHQHRCPDCPGRVPDLLQRIGKVVGVEIALDSHRGVGRYRLNRLDRRCVGNGFGALSVTGAGAGSASGARTALMPSLATPRSASQAPSRRSTFLADLILG